MLNANDIVKQTETEETAADELKEKAGTGEIVVRTIAIVLSAIFGLVTIFNIALIIMGIINPDEPASVFGYAPVVINTDAMDSGKEGSLKPGELAILKKTDYDDLKEGDVITYLVGDMILVGRISGENEENNTFTVKADTFKASYAPRLTEENFFATVAVSFPFFGDLAMFMMTPAGLIIFIAIPVFACICIAVIEVKEYIDEKKQNADAASEDTEAEEEA